MSSCPRTSTEIGPWRTTGAGEEDDLVTPLIEASRLTLPRRGLCCCRVPRCWLNGCRKGRCPLTIDRLRFEMPLYTVADVARIVEVAPSTLRSWAKGYIRHSEDRRDVTGDPVISYIQPSRRGEPSVTFIGLAEALVLAAVRRSGVPMQRVRPALIELQREIGLEHALASKKLYTDGAELLYDYAEGRSGPEGKRARDLVVVRSGQRVFADVIDAYLRRIEYGPDGYASLIHLPAYDRAKVVVDPRRAFGAPIFERGGSKIDDVLERFWAGESLDDVSAEFGVPVDELEDVLRVASRPAA